MKTWILIANAATATCYESPNALSSEPKLSEVNHFEHEASRQKVNDLIANDRPGHYQSHGINGALPESDPKQTEAEQFAREISHYLKKHHEKKTFSRLILIAPAQFIGLLRKHIDFTADTIECVKDYTQHTIHELPKILAKQLYEK